MALLEKDLYYTPPYIEILQREVKHRVRYYSLRIYRTLFNEYLLEIQYGSTKNKSHTGKKEFYYKQLEDALLASVKRVQEKLKKGYTRV
jgi:predicted DNA-binding WGR domain protein